MGKIKEYHKGELTVVWDHEACIHSEKCVKGLPEVFKPTEKPWIDTSGATEEEIAEQIKKCPSGALKFYIGNKHEDMSAEKETNIKVEVAKNGPLLVHGEITVDHSDGSTEKKSRITAFCRCGFSVNKPYCDGTHKKENFVG